LSIIATRQLTKRYGERIGILDLTVGVPEGVVFGFLGPNGSGKTTAIRVLLGLLRPTAGAAAIFGLDCWRDGHRIRAEVGYVPGDLRLYHWLTCRQALRVFGRVRRRDLTALGLALAEEFGLDPDVRVRHMSRGMRQKLGLILAMAHEPRLLVLDEPTTALDPIVQEKLYQQLRRLASAGHTIFFSSHTLSEVEQLCDRVAILREGRLVADEALETLRARAERLVVIRWKDTARTDEIRPPDCLALSEHEHPYWQGTVTGPVIELLRWGAVQPIEDISISPPDLADLFQRYYANPEDDP
jgi:ABC-2 type transport system ATP-binding protein